MKTKSSNVLIILNSVSIFLAFIGLLAAKYMTSVDMATGIALFPHAQCGYGLTLLILMLFLSG
jgi:hypothetical protein